MRSARSRITLLAAVSLVATPLQATFPAEGPGPPEILRKVSLAYASCQTYRDEGIVVVQFIGPDGKVGKQEPEDRFTTAFVRPGRFLLDFRHGSGGAQRSAVWTVKGAARSWWDVDGKVERSESLDFALGARAGVTRGVSTEVPNLLLARVGKGSPFSQLKSLKRLEDVKLDGADCWQVEGRFEAINFETKEPFATVYAYGVDKETGLIRRVRTEMVFDGVRSVATITYKPRADALIADEALSFDPVTAAK